MRAMTLRLPDDIHEQLRKEAYESRRSMNELVLEALTGRDALVARAVRAELEWSEAAGQLDSMTEEKRLIDIGEYVFKIGIKHRGVRRYRTERRLVSPWVEVPESEGQN